jgi:hypothetical protein
MICRLLTADALAADTPTLKRVMRFTRPGSDYQWKLHRYLRGKQPSPDDGSIAVVEVGRELVGWARTEVWVPNRAWDTLEAFVPPEWRRRGVAALAASLLVASGALPALDSNGKQTTVAVFRPSMLLLARRVGLHPILFAREGDQWVRQ